MVSPKEPMVASLSLVFLASPSPGVHVWSEEDIVTQKRAIAASYLPGATIAFPPSANGRKALGPAVSWERWLGYTPAQTILPRCMLASLGGVKVLPVGSGDVA